MLLQEKNNAVSVGVLYICCGKYDVFWDKFRKSACAHLLKDSKKHFYVFTDSLELLNRTEKDTTYIYQKNLGWPDSTLERFSIFLKSKDLLLSCDYLLFCNSNLQIKKDISLKDLGFDGRYDLLATIHPGYQNSENIKYPYERNSRSAAFIPVGVGDHYYAGGLQGGKSTRYLEAAKDISESINQDKSNKIIALWHDESHWNRYLLNNVSLMVLSSEYLHPEGWVNTRKAKVVIKNKDVWVGNAYLRNDGKRNSILSIMYKLLMLYITNLVRHVIKR